MRMRLMILAALVASAAVGAVVPASADEGWHRHEWREHAWREHEWRERQWREQREHEWREEHRFYEPRYGYSYGYSYAQPVYPWYYR